MKPVIFILAQIYQHTAVACRYRLCAFAVENL